MIKVFKCYYLAKINYYRYITVLKGLKQTCCLLCELTLFYESPKAAHSRRSKALNRHVVQQQTQCYYYSTVPVVWKTSPPGFIDVQSGKDNQEKGNKEYTF